ncbi:MAG: DUF2939 domain-containing protein [Syntrophales bacterium LBB04]|nr:DUF2939 domain-containing protein [Syntrophales bacterium LBB04]
MGHHRQKSKAKFQWMKYVVFMAVFAIAAVVLALYSLPFVAYYQVESAIITKNADKLAASTGLAEMRRNLKAQRGQRVIKNIIKDNAKDQSLVDLSILWSELSTDNEIDRAISTEGFYVALSGAVGTKPDAVKPAPEMSTYQMVRNMIDNASFSYKSLSKFVVSVRDDKGRYAEYFSFVFTREGLNWRLTNVILPVI